MKTLRASVWASIAISLITVCHAPAAIVAYEITDATTGVNWSGTFTVTSLDNVIGSDSDVYITANSGSPGHAQYFGSNSSGYIGWDFYDDEFSYQGVFSLTSSTLYQKINNDGSWDTTWNELNGLSFSIGGEWDTTFQLGEQSLTGAGGTITFMTVVPEPAFAGPLMAVGALGMALLSRCKPWKGATGSGGQI